MPKVKPAICPLCGETLTHVTRKGTRSKETMHAYICNECPFIGLEFYTMNDLYLLAEHLSGRGVEPKAK